MTHIPPHVLELTNVHHAYGPNPVLNGVDLHATQGERIALMGPSGSGKSTLLNCIAGIDLPHTGHIRVGGQDLARLSDSQVSQLRREKMGYVFQAFHLLPTLSVEENVAFPLQLLGAGRTEIDRRVEELLNRVGIAHRRHALPDELSGGETQRTAVARALVHRPPLLLADEPTGNLDSKNGEAVLDLLEELAEEHHTTLVMVTHSAPSTRICSRVVHMLDGRCQEPATPKAE